MEVGRSCTPTTSSTSSSASWRSAGPDVPAHGQRPGDRRLGPAGLVPAVGDGRSTSSPGSPWENPFVESFNGRVRDECSTSRSSATSPRPARCRGLADRVQHLSAPLIARGPHPGRVRQRWAPEHHKLRRPTIPPRPFRRLTGQRRAGFQPADAHSGWTGERDPVKAIYNSRAPNKVPSERAICAGRRQFVFGRGSGKADLTS